MREVKAGHHHWAGSHHLPIRELLLIAVMTLMLAVAVAPAVSAATWNSRSVPLTVEGYGSTGEAYGAFTVSTGSSGTRFGVVAHQRLAHNADNHKVWVQITYQTNAGFCFAPPYTACSQAFYYWSSDRTNGSDSHLFLSQWENAGVNPNADRGRAVIRVRLNIPWRPDPASGPSITPALRY